MKRILLLIITSILIFSIGQLNAQITVTNATFPTPGDTLKNALDPAPMGITITEPGGNQNWDYSSLVAASDSEVILRPASEGNNASAFPNADLLLPQLNGQASFVGTGDIYANVTDTEYKIVGYAGQDPADLGINVVVPFSPSIIQRRSPMNFFDINNSEYSLSFTIPADSVPSELLGQIPTAVAPDSFRLAVNATRSEIVDAWGMLTIPGGTYEVLREKRVEVRETTLEALVVVGIFEQWVDLATFDLGIPFLGLDTTITYTFLSNTEKEDIAVVTVDENDEPISVTFKDNMVTSTDNYRSTSNTDIYAQPNPAINNTRINVVNAQPGQYSFKLFNILGEQLIEKSFYINNSTEYGFSLNIDTLTKGTYLYNVADANGKIISTKRLMVIRP